LDHPSYYESFATSPALLQVLAALELLQKTSSSVATGRITGTEGGKSGVNDRGIHMAMGGVHCLPHSLSDFVPPLVGRSSLGGRVWFTVVDFVSRQARFKVAHYCSVNSIARLKIRSTIKYCEQ
jgi:hypothetical protein